MNRSLILALSLFALSCGPSSSNTCNATTCDGCCNGDECLLGNTSNACGTKGAICDVCNIGQACVSGQCFSSNPGGGTGTTTGGGAGTTGGGSGSTGGGTATTGGGVGSTGGGTATAGGGVGSTGGGSATTGGGVGSTGGGTATTGGGSGATGGGTGGNNTIAAAKQVATCTTPVQVDNAIIIAVETSSTGTSGDIRSTFWVVDQAAPGNGIYVDKFYTDTPTTFVPTVGQLVSISGAYTRNEPAYNNRTAYRLYLSNATACGVGSTPMNIALQGTVTLPAPQTLALAGANAQGGSAKPSPSYGSTLVTIPGPLTLTPATSTPEAMHRVSAYGAADTLYYGFETSGGVLVHNGSTYANCDWRGSAYYDGGTISFPNGITGVWDTYSHAPCADGGTSTSCLHANGYVPGTANDYTYAIYPRDCADFNGAFQQ